MLVLAEDALRECANKKVHVVLAGNALCVAMFTMYGSPIVFIKR